MGKTLDELRKELFEIAFRAAFGVSSQEDIERVSGLVKLIKEERK